eukprot:TRINITY_DN104689_c0_g1_i1.p1 TRINITY_DN104689_c0_g1~~TRINITY_DN104689_c0_g1_i1.p1  ORF type:complete len:737 (+),score=211.59 TRINITY_DN104689_c0_g1_i1:54-2264(+)
MMTGIVGSLLLLASAVTALTPTEKVLQMLGTLENETKSEQLKEKTNFENFSAWCDKTSEKKGNAIKEGEDEEAELLSSIEEKTSNYESLLADLAELKSTTERLEAEKDANSKQCAKDKSAYQATKVDLDSAIGGLQAALKTLQEAGGTKSQSLLLLQHASGLQQSLDLGEAMGFLQDQDHRAMVAFLQAGKAEPWLGKEGEEHNKTDYGFQSSGIVATLKDLETQFTGERDALVKEWEATQAACEQTEKDKKTALGETSQTTGSKVTESSQVKDALGEKKEALRVTRKTLKEDRSYLEDVKSDCAARDADFAQRSKNRAGEIKAIQEAIKVMKDTVKNLEDSVYDSGGAAGTKTQSLLATDSDVVVQEHSEVPSFFQQKSARRHAATEMDQAAAEMFQSRKEQAVSLLAKAGGNLRSLRLSSFAMRLQAQPTAASDPLVFVKQMTEKMINDLQKEATAATTQKGLCDTQMMKASKERDRRFRESMSLDKKIKALDTKREELIETIKLQTSDISDMEKDLSTATELRTNESTENIKTISESSVGAKAVDGAIKALKSYYAKAARSANRYDEASAFLQLNIQSKKEDPGFAGSYAGKQNQALSVVTLMEVIRDSFEQTAKETKAEEDEAAEKFTELKSKSRVDIETKRTSKTLNNEELDVTTNDISSGKEALKSTVGLLDGALAALEDLKDECVNNQMTYEERKAKREGEISQLKKAMCILDVNKVEKDCAATPTAAR